MKSEDARVGDLINFYDEDRQCLVTRRKIMAIEWTRVEGVDHPLTFTVEMDGQPIAVHISLVRDIQPQFEPRDYEHEEEEARYGVPNVDYGKKDGDYSAEAFVQGPASDLKGSVSGVEGPVGDTKGPPGADFSLGGLIQQEMRRQEETGPDGLYRLLMRAINELDDGREDDPGQPFIRQVGETLDTILSEQGLIDLKVRRGQVQKFVQALNDNYRDNFRLFRRRVTAEGRYTTIEPRNIQGWMRTFNDAILAHGVDPS